MEHIAAGLSDRRPPRRTVTSPFKSAIGSTLKQAIGGRRTQHAYRLLRPEMMADCHCVQASMGGISSARTSKRGITSRQARSLETRKSSVSEKTLHASYRTKL